MARPFIVGIDLGSAVTKTVVVSARGNEGAEVLSAVSVPTHGVRHGYVVNIPGAADSIKRSIALAEQEAGIQIKRAYFSIGGISLSSENSQGGAIISKSDGEVTAFDIKTAIASAEESLGLSLKNKRIIYSAPVGWKIDGKEIHGKPDGLHGVKLEVKMFYVTCLSQHLDDLISVAAEAGIEVLDVVPSPIAASYIALSERQKAVGVILVNIGAETVSVAVFENNLLIGLSVLPIGSTDITNDIALGFRIPLEEAESIKTGSVMSVSYPKRKVDEIVEARFSDIFELVDVYLKKIKRSGLLPAGVVITGGGSGNGLVESLARNMLRLPSKIGGADLISHIKGPARDSTWFVAFGLAMIAREGNFEIKNHTSTRNKARGFIKEFLKQFLP